VDLGLVALHHYGDPTRGRSSFNQGVAVMPIREDIIVDPDSAALLGSDPP
jgi:hypothetical protein